MHVDNPNNILEEEVAAYVARAEDMIRRVGTVGALYDRVRHGLHNAP